MPGPYPREPVGCPVRAARSYYIGRVLGAIEKRAAQEYSRGPTDGSAGPQPARRLAENRAERHGCHGAFQWWVPLVLQNDLADRMGKGGERMHAARWDEPGLRDLAD